VRAAVPPCSTSPLLFSSLCIVACLRLCCAALEAGKASVRRPASPTRPKRRVSWSISVTAGGTSTHTHTHTHTNTHTHTHTHTPGNPGLLVCMAMPSLRHSLTLSAQPVADVSSLHLCDYPPPPLPVPHTPLPRCVW
jgi:hypothetical protein